jgi:hypothetical protein
MVLTLVFPLVFNAIFFFVGGTDHKTSIWISYGFIHFAYFMLLLTPALIRDDKNSAVFGFALYSTTAVYFLLELAVGGLFILIPIFGPKTVSVIQLVMAGIYGIMLVAHMIANEKTADASQARQVQIDTIKNASVSLKLVLAKIQDKETLRKVERAYDALASSPVKSYPEFERMEKGILVSIEAINNAVCADNKSQIISLAESLLQAINERNMRLKSHY